jgi:hypothetical protein
MLRTVLSRVEVVPSSSSSLREPAVVCDHLFEPGYGSSAAAVRTGALPRPEVDREGSPDVDAAVFLHRLTAPVLPPGQARVERGRSSLRSKLGPAKILVQTRVGLRAVPVAKTAKEKVAQPGACSGRLPPFQAIMVYDRNHLEERLGPAAKRR